MVSDDWEADYLNKMEGEAGLTDEEMRWLVGFFAFQRPKAEPATQERAASLLFRDDATEPVTVAYRFYLLGSHIGRLRERRIQKRRAEKAAGGGASESAAEREAAEVALTELDPNLQEFLSNAQDRAASDHLRDLHLQAQSALLKAVTQQATACTDADVLRLLADAYLTIPSPGEDFADGT